MTVNKNNKGRLLRKSVLASCIALYSGSAVYAAVEQTRDGGFGQPEVDAAAFQAAHAQRQAELTGNLFVGQPGVLNQHRGQQDGGVFNYDPEVTGVQSYIVQFEHQPVATYNGGVQGFAATARKSSRNYVGRSTLSMADHDVRSYSAFLSTEQDKVLSQARGHGAALRVSRQLTIANNAAVVEMSQNDALILSQQPGVKRITPNRMLSIRTDRGPEFIGATSVWQGTAVPSGIGAKGEGMVVGVLDTGINTDHPAFADDGSYASSNPFGAGNYVGDCETDPSLCNDKLVGVRSYSDITDSYKGPEWQDNPWGTPQMARPANGEDYNGHGSHTASTAAGNLILDTPLQMITGEAVSDGIDVPFAFPQTSGVAPRAHIVSYQVCLPGQSGDPYAGCPESAILAAIDDAILDGVDVINFSIGGAESLPWRDPIELGFLAAREAGISVAAAAGNAGAFWSADHSSPWVTTVGAASHDRVMAAGVKALQNFGADSTRPPSEAIQGVSFSGSITGEVVLAGNYADPDPTDDFGAETCNVPFPAGTFTSDQIVLCERGGIPRTDKAVHVAAGGAGGFILQNIDWRADNLVAEEYVIPGIQVPRSVRWQLRNWVNNSAAGTATATITDYQNYYDFDEALANNLAPFTSMGPSRTNNTLVPDVVAPGVQIYAANADDQPFTAAPRASDWTFMSGTSMASPHVAGAMALLAQAHPDWSPAEIQSALMLTAGEVRLNNGYTLLEPYNNAMMGSGSINVERAVRSGLVMDESIENYRDADPSNGGTENWLNVPSMVEMNCDQSCSWMRTVTATADGSWTVTGQGKEEGVEVTVTPASFTLQAGQSQTLVINVEVPDRIEHNIEPDEPGGAWDNVGNAGMLFNGNVVLTETSGRHPTAHMPILVGSSQGQLPSSIDIDYSRDYGSARFTLDTEAFSELTPRFYGPVKPTTSTATLDAVGPFLEPDQIERGWDIQLVDVPVGTKRLVVETQRAEIVGGVNPLETRYAKLMPYIIMGRDANGNQGFIPSAEADASAIKAEYDSELVCMSTSQSEHNYCSLENPAPGQYWVATAMAYGEGAVEVTTGYAVLHETDDLGLLSLSGTPSHDGQGRYDVELHWNLPEAEQGERYYGAFDLGVNADAPGSIGFASLNFKRAKDVVEWRVSQTKARPQQLLDVKLKLNANLERDDRSYDLDVALPEGLRIVPETVRISRDDLQEQLSVSDVNLNLSGQQISTRDVAPEYVMTTNLSSAQCHTPLIDEYSSGGYIDLFEEFGIQPNAPWLVGDATQFQDVPLNWLFANENAKFELYNAESGGYVRLHNVGVLQFNGGFWPMKWDRGPGFLGEAIAPFWRGSFEMTYARHWEDPQGLTIASQYASERPDLGDLVFLEYDNVTDTNTGETFDYQVILRSGMDYNPDMFEIVLAYDNLGANVAEGGIFIEGFTSTWSKNGGPKDGYHQTFVGYDNLDEVLEDDLVMCFDYQGPEQSEVELSFQVFVQPEAVGQTLPITLTHMIERGETVTKVHDVAVQGNIQIAPIADMSVDENSRIDDIRVQYTDVNAAPNVIEATGDNVTAEVEGDSFNLIPAEHFHGETTVTVTVYDSEYPTDKASTSFTLTVVSDGQEPPATGGGDNGGSEPDSGSSSSGNMGWLFVFASLLMVGVRRRR
ncbi:peptidase S8 [Pseudidiomarina sediminum]|uniref:Peptidase S8 n=1 Tax=Pseudidiomarina sediminum TaxID=431675 RepID=A0A432Z3E2_9GAMM|nr:S8 family serine peptidase [Pseudidiomarina sediminum]RUO72369.1 peptidase S8 [Pseudidiomarina sediminum]